MGIELKMTDQTVFNEAARKSADSGEQLLIETQNLENAVEALKDTFKGAGATAYTNFMVQVDECQKKLAEALGLINVGQADLYQAYLDQEEETVANAEGTPVDFPFAR
jgi:uncharacterized protein YukE